VRRLGWAPYALLLPSLVFLALLFATPMVQAFALGLQDRDGTFGLASIERMVGDSNFRNAVTTTLALVVLVLPVQFVLAMSMALIINARLKGQGLWLYVYALPLGISELAAGIVWVSIFTQTGWLNTPEGKPLRMEALLGKVVLVEFWTYACFNCRNVLPYVKGWHEKYATDGLVVIGVHTPELDFERKPENVKKKVAELGITFPVVLDPDYVTWDRYGSRAWPTIYLIDPAGRIVYVAVGEGSYDRTEARIRDLLKQVTRAGN